MMESHWTHCTYLLHLRVPCHFSFSALYMVNKEPFHAVNQAVTDRCVCPDGQHQLVHLVTKQSGIGQEDAG